MSFVRSLPLVMTYLVGCSVHNYQDIFLKDVPAALGMVLLPIERRGRVDLDCVEKNIADAILPITKHALTPSTNKRPTDPPERLVLEFPWPDSKCPYSSNSGSTGRIFVMASNTSDGQYHLGAALVCSENFQKNYELDVALESLRHECVEEGLKQ